MKSIQVSIIFILFFLFSQSTVAQTGKPDISIVPEEKLPPLNFTINIGYGAPNLEGHYYQTQGTGSNGGSYNPIYLELGYNYLKKGVVSLYLSSAAGATGNFTFVDTALVTHTYSYYASIFTVGLSTKYYFGNGTHFAPYVGGMAGYSFVNFNDLGDVPAFGAASVNAGSFNYHVYVGSSWFFNSWLGLDARIGYGNSYYGSVGLSFKIEVMQEDDID